MITATKTLAAMAAQQEAAAEEPFRRHLGASIIGDECARKIYYSWRWVMAEKFDARMLRLFNRGHLEEPRFIGFLRAIGVEIWEVNPVKGGQYKVSAHYGHFGGSLDAVGRNLPDLPPDTPFLLEFKTHNDKSFKQLKENGIMKTKWKHFVQMQDYMGLKALQWALYCATNKDTDEILLELVQFSQTDFDRSLKRAGEIIFAETPPPRVNHSPSFWKCKFCHLREFCHFGKGMPERNCRTCIHSIPSKDGSGNWLCTIASNDPKLHLSLDEAAQRAGCGMYEVNPVLLNPKL